MSAVPEYFDIIFIRVLRKIKKVFFMIVKKDKMLTRKPLFFIFPNKRVQLVPKYSGTAKVSKTVSGLIIKEKTVVVRAKIRVFWPHATPVQTCLAGIATTSLQMS